MASAGYAITITAQDRASAAIDGINRRFAALNAQVARTMAPFTRLRESFAKFLSLSGLDKIASGFSRLAQTAYSAFSSMMRIVEPLAAIVGAASLAGMYRLISAWSDFGSKLGFSAQRIGIAADQLQALQGAAKLAGGSSEGMSNALTSLNDTLNAMVGGRDPEAIAMFQALGVAFDDGHGHALPLLQVLPALADKIASISDPANQARAGAKAFGTSVEDILPLLRRGSAGIDELTAQARRYGSTNAEAVENANRFRVAQTSLTLAVQGLANAVANQLAPILGPYLQQLADWIAKNKELVAIQIGAWAKDFAEFLKGVDWTAVGAGIKEIGEDVLAVIRYLASWKDDLVLLGRVSMAAVDQLTAPFRGVIEALKLIVKLKHLAFGDREPVEMSGPGIVSGSDRALGGPEPSLSEQRPWWNPYLGYGSPGEPPLFEGRPGGVPGGGLQPPPTPYVPSGPPMPGGSGPAPSFDASIPPEGRALLDTLHRGEAPDYNLGNTIGNPTHFGPYQFDEQTYGDMVRRTGRPGRTLEDQQVNAWALAQQAFRENHGPGGDLLTFLRQGGDPQPYLRGRWPSVLGGSQQARQAPDNMRYYREQLLRRQTEPGAAPPTPAAPPAPTPQAPAAAPTTIPQPPTPSRVSYRVGGGDGVTSAAQQAERLAGRADLIVRFANPPAGLSSTLNVTGNLWGAGPRVEMGLPSESRT